MRSAQVSHTHRSRLVGMARNMRYLMRLLTLESGNNLWRDPIDAFIYAKSEYMSQ